MFPLTLRVHLDHDESMDKAWEAHHVFVLKKTVPTEEERRKAWRRIYMKMMVIFALMFFLVLGFLVISFLENRSREHNVSNLWFPLMMLLIPLKGLFDYWCQWRKSDELIKPPVFRSSLWPYWPKSDYFQEVIWRFEKESIHRELRGQSQEFAYTDFAKILDSPAGLLLYPQRKKGLRRYIRKIIPTLPDEFYFIPKEAFPSLEAKAALVEKF